MKRLPNRHLTSILTASEAVPFLFCANQPWHVPLHRDKLINGVWLLPVTGTRTPCTSDNILNMHYISFQIVLFLQMRNADRGMLGNSEQRGWRQKVRPRWRKASCLFMVYIHTSKGPWCSALSGWRHSYINNRKQNTRNTPNTTIW